MVTGSELAKIEKIDNTETEVDLDIREMKVEKNSSINFFATKKELNQYCNKVLYTYEKRLLEGFDVMMQDEDFIAKGRHGRRYRTYTQSMILEQLYGRPGDHKLDSPYARLYSKVLSYYSSSVSRGSGSRKEKRYTNKTGYHLSISRIKNCPPYSLKLRYEKFCDQGIVPTVTNMKLPKDDLKICHSRYKVADLRKQEMRKKARERYEEGVNKNNKQQK